VMSEFATSIVVVLVPLLALAGAGVLVAVRVRRLSSVRSTALRWPHTMGTVLSVTVQMSRQGATRQEAPLVLYAYQVKGQVFQGSRVRACDANGRRRAAGTQTSAANTVTRYPAGAPVIVYYDPTDPAISALER
jgi:hypothetical protein